jgi:hypothetical protein
MEDGKVNSDFLINPEFVVATDKTITETKKIGETILKAYGVSFLAFLALPDFKFSDILSPITNMNNGVTYVATFT